MAVKKLYENTYRISEWGAFGCVKMYLLIGKERALLIDSGYGKCDLKKIVSGLTAKPVLLYDTHGHIDHVGGSAQFEAYLHPADNDVYISHTSPELTQRYCKGKPIERAKMRELKTGILDLGGRTVEIIHTPGHTQGSVCVLDGYSKMAFCGDTINPWDVWLGLDESTSVTDYRKSLVRLLDAVERCSITKLHSGHSGMAMSVKRLQNYIVLCSRIIEGRVKCRNAEKGICKGMKSRYKNAALIWRKK